MPRICSRDGCGSSLGLLVIPLANAKFDEDEVNDSSKFGSSGAAPLKAVNHVTMAMSTVQKAWKVIDREAAPGRLYTEQCRKVALGK